MLGGTHSSDIMEYNKEASDSARNVKGIVGPATTSVGSPDYSSQSISRGDIEDATAIPDDFITNTWQRQANRLIGFIGAEARGVERVDEAFRVARLAVRDYVSMTVVWFSVNLTVCPFIQCRDGGQGSNVLTSYPSQISSPLEFLDLLPLDWAHLIL